MYAAPCRRFPPVVPAAPISAVLPLIETDEPKLSPSEALSSCCSDQTPLLPTNTYVAPPANAPGAPTSAVLPLIATDEPNSSPSNPSEAVSSCCCDQLPPLFTNTYAAPKKKLASTVPTSTVLPLIETVEPNSSNACPSEAVSFCCCDQAPLLFANTYAVPWN